LLAKARAAPPRVPGPAPTDAPGDVLQLILRALASGQPAPAPGGAAPASVGSAPILSPIDKMLGGQALVGKKTALSVVAYVVLAILQTAGVIGVATPAGQILTVLITAFGALGGVSKIDRVIQELGIIAAKVPRGAIPRQ
jgi:hypothetical protein